MDGMGNKVTLKQPGFKFSLLNFFVTFPLTWHLVIETVHQSALLLVAFGGGR